MRQKPFRVVFSPAAVRDLEGIEPGAAVRLVKDVAAYLGDRPIPFGKSRIKKLTSFDPPLFRIRSGDLRAYYRIRGEEVVILVVTQRKDSDKRLKRISEDPASLYARRKRSSGARGKNT
jgi:mRNA-degrading endonuclease RelE of RelBE toxin-antitoxin system